MSACTHTVRCAVSVTCRPAASRRARQVGKKPKPKPQVKARPKPFTSIDYLRIGRAIGKRGYCGECIGCLCYRDFCDWADELRDHDYDRDMKRKPGV